MSGTININIVVEQNGQEFYSQVEIVDLESGATPVVIKDLYSQYKYIVFRFSPRISGCKLVLGTRIYNIGPGDATLGWISENLILRIQRRDFEVNEDDSLTLKFDI